MSRSITTMDIQEIIRRGRAGQSDRAIHEELGLHRDTVRKYRRWIETQGLLEGELPDLETLQRRVSESLPQPRPPQNESSVEPYRDKVEHLRAAGVEIKAIYQRLQESGYRGSYQSVWRFVRRLEPVTPQATVRVERAPGEEAQVDFDPIAEERRHRFFGMEWFFDEDERRKRLQD